MRNGTEKGSRACSKSLLLQAFKSEAGIENRRIQLEGKL
jgi:hypothetical protein